jgi:MFS family permease
MVFHHSIFPCAFSHRCVCLLFFVLGFFGVQQNLDWYLVGGVGDCGNCMVFYTGQMDAQAAPYRMACALLCWHVLRMGVTAQWADVLWILLLALALHALTFAANHTVCIALLSHHFPGRLRGRGQALYTVIAYGFPGVIGGLVGGLLSDQFGLQSVYWASMAVAMIATLSAWKVWRLQHPANASQPKS